MDANKEKYTGEILIVAIIDFFTNYDLRKNAETFIKSIMNDRVLPLSLPMSTDEL